MAVLTNGIFVTKIEGRVSDGLYQTTPARKGSIAFVRKMPQHEKTYRSHSEHNFCPCAAWSTCDALWITKTAQEQQTWRDAVSKAGMSGYDVWMKECLALTISGQYAPDEPSPSGGWSTNSVQAGDTYPPPEECGGGPPPPPANCTAAALQCDGASSVTATISGLTGPCSLLNGQFSLPRVDTLYWQRSSGEPYIDFNCFYPGVPLYYFRAQGDLPYIWVQARMDLNCEGDHPYGTFDAPGGNICDGQTATVVIPE